MEEIKNLEMLENKYCYRFKDKNLLREALTHKSYNKPYNNERLEFLGDAILGLTIAEFLFFKFENEQEGTLSKIRSSIVSEEGLYKLAIYLGIGKSIFMSGAEERNGGRTKKSILSDTFEAIIGVIYLESGIKETKKIIYNILYKNYEDFSVESVFKDYKTILQEITQAMFGVIPEYRLIKAFGPDHNKQFKISLYIDDKLYVTRNSNSKKSTEQLCAKATIDILKKLDE